MKTALITGGLGFIGTHIAIELLKKKEISMGGSTSYLNSENFINNFSLNIKELKKYLKSKNISIR